VLLVIGFAFAVSHGRTIEAVIIGVLALPALFFVIARRSVETGELGPGWAGLGQRSEYRLSGGLS